MKANTLHVLLAARRARDHKDPVGAERLYRQVLAAHPSDPRAALELGTILTDAARYDEALAVVSPAAQAHAGDAELRASLGRCLWLGGRARQAVVELERAVSLDPRSGRARTWLAECRMGALRWQEALALLAPVLASDQRDPLARSIAGRALVVGGRTAEGIGQFRASLALGPSEGTHTALAWSLKRAGLLTESLAEFDAALASWPGSPSLLAGKGEVLALLGDHEAGLRVVEGALDRGALTAEVALAFAHCSKPREKRGAAVAVLERALAELGPGAPLRDALLFALGAFRDAAGEYDGAFECFRRANELAGSQYDRGVDERGVKELMEVFSAPNLAGLPRATNTDPLPVFIVGMPRSGTSLVEQILASHPSVYGAGELPDMSALAGGIPGLLGLPGTPGFPSCVLGLGAAQLGSLARRHVDRLGALGPGALRVTDKMPQNFRLLGLIELLFPGARVVHCRRNPVDTCLSLYMTDMNQLHAYRHRFGDLAFAYGLYRGLMAHWQSVLRTPILDVQYEDLITDTHATVRRLLDFVGLPWDDRCVRPHENKRVVTTSSADQVRRPIYDSSVNRWRNYERHIPELIDALGPWLRAEDGAAHPPVGHGPGAGFIGAPVPRP